MGCCASKDNAQSNTPVPQTSVEAADTKKSSNTNLHKYTSRNAPEVEQKETSRSSAELSFNADTNLPDERKAEFKLRMSQHKSEMELEKKKLTDLKTQILSDQVSKVKLLGLYDIFQKHSTNGKKMDIDGVTDALREFGMVINTQRSLQKFVFSKFDIDNEGEIDYNDFMATMSSLIGTKNEDSLLLMFQIFDMDQDGYLNTENIAMIILAQNQIALAVTGKIEDANANEAVTLSKRICLKLARKIITKYDSDDFADGKISFEEYKEMMMNTTADEMMFTNKSGLPSLDSIGTPSGFTSSAEVPSTNK